MSFLNFVHQTTSNYRNINNKRLLYIKKKSKNKNCYLITWRCECRHAIIFAMMVETEKQMCEIEYTQNKTFRKRNDDIRCIRQPLI